MPNHHGSRVFGAVHVARGMDKLDLLHRLRWAVPKLQEGHLTFPAVPGAVEPRLHSLNSAQISESVGVSYRYRFRLRKAIHAVVPCALAFSCN